MAEYKEKHARIYAKDVAENLFYFKGRSRETYIERMMGELGMDRGLFKIRDNREWRRTRDSIGWLAESAEKDPGQMEGVKRLLKAYFDSKGTTAESVTKLARIAGEMREGKKGVDAAGLSPYISVPKAAPPAPLAKAPEAVPVVQKPQKKPLSKEEIERRRKIQEEKKAKEGREAAERRMQEEKTAQERKEAAERAEAAKVYRKGMSESIDNFVKETTEQYNGIFGSFSRIGSGTMTYREIFSKGTPQYDAISRQMNEAGRNYATFRDKAVYLSNYLKSGSVDAVTVSKKMKGVSDAYGKYTESITGVAKRIEEYRVNRPLDMAGLAFDVAVTAALVYALSTSGPKMAETYKKLRLATKQGVGASAKVALSSAKKSLATAVAKGNLGKTAMGAARFFAVPAAFGAMVAAGEAGAIWDVNSSMTEFNTAPRKSISGMRGALESTMESVKAANIGKAQKDSALELLDGSLREISAIEKTLLLPSEVNAFNLSPEETKRVASAFVSTTIAVAAIQAVFYLPRAGKAVTRKVTPAKVARQAATDLKASHRKAISNIGAIFRQNGMKPQANISDITQGALVKYRVLKQAGKAKEAEKLLLDVGRELRVFKSNNTVALFGTRAKSRIGVNPVLPVLPQRTAIAAEKAREGTIAAAKAAGHAVADATKATTKATAVAVQKAKAVTAKGAETTKAAYGVVEAKTKEAFAPVAEGTKSIYGRGRKIAKGAVDYFRRTIALDEAKNAAISKYPEAARKAKLRDMTSVSDVMNTALARARTMKKADAKAYLESVRAALRQGFSAKDKRMMEFAKGIREITE